MKRANMSAVDKWQPISTTDKTHPFPHALFSEDWIFVTGIGGHIPGTDSISPDTKEQTRQALKNVEELLNKAGSSFSEVVQIKPYITDRSYAAPMDAVLTEVISEPRPASGALLICQLIDERMHVEFEVIAKRGAIRAE